MQNTPNLQYIIANLVELAQSGHPGAAISLTPLFQIIHTILRYDPDDSSWPDRDALILSNGHACLLQYLFLHLTNRLSFQDLLQFRTVNSKTPGHPEASTNGIEVSTGPLGQGLANAVGFGLSQRMVNATGISIAIFGDGCYMEGISHEAFALAAHYKSRVLFIYDCNGVTIDGSVDLAMTEDYVKRFEGYGFNVRICDGYENVEDILKIKVGYMRNLVVDCEDSYKDLMDDRILMLVLKNKIASGTGLEGDCRSHGAPLGQDIIDKFAEKNNIKTDEFIIPEEIYEYYNKLNMKNREIRKNWNKKMVEEKKNIMSNTPFYNQVPDLNPLHSQSFYYNIEESVFDDIFKVYDFSKNSIATRKAFSNILDYLHPYLPFLIVGSADLTPSCLTKTKTSVNITANSNIGSYIHYGIREHGMFGVMNGLSAHGFFLPIGSTFLNFVTYGFPALRLAALSKSPSMYILTHDSIGLGEDGPTHQPIETLTLLRATPDLITFRPCNEIETFFAFKYAVMHAGPVVLSLSRQKINYIVGTDYLKCKNGAYFVEKNENSSLTLLATGSEVALALDVAKVLKCSVVSMLSYELFEQMPIEYKKEILNGTVISIEAGATLGWHKYADYCIGIDTFGKSGNGKDVYKYFEFDEESIVRKIRKYLSENK